MATSPRPSIDNELASPRGIGGHRVPGFILPRARFIHDNINSKEVCRVFVLRCQSAFNLTCQVLSHRVTCRIQFKQSYKLHITFIHSCIRTSILSHIHTFMHTHIHTPCQFTHDCVSHPESCPVIPHQFSHQFFQVVGPKQRTA